MITTTRRRVTALSVGVLTALTIGTTASSAQAASPQPGTDHDGRHCSTGVLPDSVIGSPAVQPGQAAGVYLWHGSDGYSLRVTHPGTGRTVFRGTLTASSSFSHVARVALEKDDWVRVSGNHRTLTFRFVDVGRIDGFNFSADCSRRVTLSLRVNGAWAGPELVKLGRHGTSPTSNPFTIERHADPAGRPTPGAPTGTRTPASGATATSHASAIGRSTIA